MELDLNKITVVHNDEKVIKIFDNPKEALLFADGARIFKAKIAVDPLRNFIYHYVFNKYEVNKLKIRSGLI